jgi:general secretion pathway protein G
MNGRTERAISLKEKDMQKQRFRATRRAAARGLTLVELVLVITIIGVLTAAISVGVMRAKKTADVGTAKTACSSVKSATLLWKNAHPDLDCPTVEQLKKERFLDTGFTPKDAWGNPFKVVCDADEITCSTAGPDRKEGTDDDIIVPPPEQSEK